MKFFHTTRQRAQNTRTGEQSDRRKKSSKRTHRVLLGFLCVLLAAVSAVGLGMWTSRYPDKINMGTACDMEGMNHIGTMGNICQGSISGNYSTPIADLQAPQTAIHIKTFALTAQYAHLPFSIQGQQDAWTFNGTSPGPTLRVQQGDLVVVHLVNHLSVGVTIHWHGVDVPNIADGVAGVTQDAVKPGQSYTYRFIAKDPGTYWYHSHQESFEETSQGLYGMVIVDPAKSLIHDDVDNGLVLHTWNGSLAINMAITTQHINAQPGQWVRIRLLNTDDTPHLITLAGTPFLVAALDGHDINGPIPLTAVPLSIDGGQRYDLRFRMPERGPVALLLAKEGEQQYHTNQVVLIGQEGENLASLTIPPIKQQVFDMTTYGLPTQDTITPQSHFDASYNILLGFSLGFSNGRPGPVFTINGQGFPNTPTIVVKPSQLIRLHLVNDSGNTTHPMHIHGHTLTVLTKNGRALTGSPIHLDTISVGPHESYDVAFYANNPGLWMLHCHNLFHANHGMDMMIVYPNISTPYTIGNVSGNFPD